MSGTLRQKGLDLFNHWTLTSKSERVPPWRLRNFGDELNPALFQAASGGIVPAWSDLKSADCVYLGSVIHRAAIEARPGTVLIGTGMPGGIGADLLARVKTGLARLDVRSVRGPLTRERLGLPTSLTVGDPAILLKRRARETEKRGRGVLVVHFGTLRSGSDLKQVARKAEVLNLDIVSVADPADSVVERIAQARVVVSSSLHGIIVADALGTPALPATLATEPHHDFRFDDYAASVNRRCSRRQPLSRLSNTDVEEVIAAGECFDGKLMDDLAAELLELSVRWQQG